jgi:hypothetical protein
MQIFQIRDNIYNNMDLAGQRYIHSHCKVHRLTGRIALILLYTFAHPQLISSQHGSNFPMEATRLNNNQPIITREHFTNAGASDEKEGANINGPSVIRIPNWIPSLERADPGAVYYMYFAHHVGEYIRLAWAADIEGPWNLYQVADSIPLEDRGVLSLGKDEEITVGNGITINRHVASPEIIIDDENKRIIMYFHAPSNFNGEENGQRTFVATSPFGLDFNGNIEPVIICNAYVRVFDYQGDLYAHSFDYFYRAPSLSNPWTPPAGFDYSEMLWTQSDENAFDDYLDVDPSGLGSKNLSTRHADILLTGDTLHILYSRRRDIPERILYTYVDLRKDFNNWRPEGPFQEILRPELEWEGAAFPVKPSKGGSTNCCVQELRDPDIFRDSDGRIYLFYTGQGENAIGMASLSRKEI